MKKVLGIDSSFYFRNFKFFFKLVGGGVGGGVLVLMGFFWVLVR